MNKKLKVAIIGCGGIANDKHLPSLKKIDQVEMVAFCDIEVKKAKKAALEYGTASTITEEDILNLTLLNEAAALSNKESRRIELKEIIGGMM